MPGTPRNPRRHRTDRPPADSRTRQSSSWYFFIVDGSGTTAGKSRTLTSILGDLVLTANQASYYQVKAYSRWSPGFERCCLLLSGAQSYQRAAADVEMLTGLKMSRSTHQRLVQRQDFPDLEVSQPSEPVEEMSLDGGKVRLRTPEGEASEWRDYKAVNLHGHGVAAFFGQNEDLVAWLKTQLMASLVVCLGDGHPGIWNLFAQIGDQQNRLEILDWYHLMENLEKVGGSAARLSRVRCHLWRGEVEQALAEFDDWQHPRVDNFRVYLKRHCHRLVNYDYYQCEGISIGSGAVESTVKQFSGRLKLPGAQWKRENVPQVLKHRSAYLNGEFSRMPWLA